MAFYTSSGHSGIEVTTKRVLALLYWKGIRKDIQTFIQGCDICQGSKTDLARYPGLLQPLHIPKAVWAEISLDSVE